MTDVEKEFLASVSQALLSVEPVERLGFPSGASPSDEEVHQVANELMGALEAIGSSDALALRKEVDATFGMLLASRHGAQEVTQVNSEPSEVQNEASRTPLADHQIRVPVKYLAIGISVCVVLGIAFTKFVSAPSMVKSPTSQMEAGKSTAAEGIREAAADKTKPEIKGNEVPEAQNSQSSSVESVAPGTTSSKSSDSDIPFKVKSEAPVASAKSTNQNSHYSIKLVKEIRSNDTISAIGLLDKDTLVCFFNVESRATRAIEWRYAQDVIGVNDGSEYSIRPDNVRRMVVKSAVYTGAYQYLDGKNRKAMRLPPEWDRPSVNQTSPEGRFVANTSTSSTGGESFIWDLDSKKQISEIPSSVGDVKALTSDGTAIVKTRDSKWPYFYLWDCQKNAQRPVYDHVGDKRNSYVIDGKSVNFSVAEELEGISSIDSIVCNDSGSLWVCVAPWSRLGGVYSILDQRFLLLENFGSAGAISIDGSTVAILDRDNKDSRSTLVKIYNITTDGL